MSHKVNYFELSSIGETAVITFETRIMDGKLPSGSTFECRVLNKIRLTSQDYLIVSVQNNMTYVNIDT